MKQIPILFSTPMVKAILEGRKTQTRRIVKGTPLEWLSAFTPEFVSSEDNNLCPYGNTGDTLWVRETWSKINYPSTVIINAGMDKEFDYIYKASHDGIDRYFTGWRPSIHMPKAACRIFLQIKSIRVERLQDITEDEAKSEGVQYHFDSLFQEYRYRDYDTKLQKGYGDPKVDYPTWREAKSSFISLWKSINGPESWDLNPMVWVIEFEKTEKP